VLKPLKPSKREIDSAWPRTFGLKLSVTFPSVFVDKLAFNKYDPVMRKATMVGFVFFLLMGSSCDLPSSNVTSPSSSSVPSGSNTSPSAAAEIRAIEVITGDTIKVEQAGKQFLVKYLGLTAPGLDQSAGKEALARNRELVDGKIIRLEKDVTDADAEGRLLRYVYVGGIFVNAEMIRLGYARASVLSPDTQYQDLILRLEMDARFAGRGIWTPTRTTSLTPTKKPTPNTEVTIPPPRD
jgi:endonuclease YncB( thermonuclease family)